METIWKYPLENLIKQEILMPQNAQILCVQLQRDTPCLWVKVDPDAPMVKRTIMIHGTGHMLRGMINGYIGSYQLRGGDLIFHVFESSA